MGLAGLETGCLVPSELAQGRITTHLQPCRGRMPALRCSEATLALEEVLLGYRSKAGLEWLLCPLRTPLAEDRHSNSSEHELAPIV